MSLINSEDLYNSLVHGAVATGVTASGYSTTTDTTSLLFDQNYGAGWLSAGSGGGISAVKFIFDSPQVSLAVFTALYYILTYTDP